MLVLTRWYETMMYARPAASTPLRFAARFAENDVTARMQGPEKPLDIENFRRALAQAKHPYVGKLPAVLRTVYPESPADLLRALDAAARTLRAAYYKNHDWPQAVMTGQNGHVMRLYHATDHVSNFGTVYRLDAGAKSFAFKIYKNPAQEQYNRHGSLLESYIGLVLGRFRLKDVSRFHVGNAQAGWNLYEWIGPKTDVGKRPGVALLQLPVSVYDNKDQNWIPCRNGRVRVDHGGIVFNAGDLVAGPPGTGRAVDEPDSPAVWRLP